MEVRAFTAPLTATVARAVPATDYGKGVAYALVAGVALGVLGPVSNIAYAAGMGSATFAAMRATIGAVVLFGVIALAHHPTIRLASLTGRERSLLLLTAVAQAVLSLCLFAAYGAMAVALVLAVYFCYPILVALASIVLGRERLTWIRALALTVAIGGLVTVVLGGEVAGVSISVAGLLLAIGASICQATYLVASRAGFTRVPSEQAIALILGGAAVIIWLAAIPIDGLSGSLFAWVGAPAAWASIAIAGVIGAALAKVCMLRGVRRVGGTRASVLMLSEPLVGVGLAGVLLGQGLEPVQVLGGIGVLVGAVLAQRPAPALMPA